MVRPEPPRERYVPPVMADTKEGDTVRLVEFLQDRDAPCPLCGYNLRNLTGDVCPECGQKLLLTVGVHHMRFGWFLATVTPSLFSGIAANSDARPGEGLVRMSERDAKKVSLFCRATNVRGRSRSLYKDLKIATAQVVAIIMFTAISDTQTRGS